MSRKFLIINADDVGFSKASAGALAEAVGRGALTSCSLVANCGEIREIADKLKKANPDVDLGIHLNLTEGAPVSPPGKVPSLIGDDGRFPGLAGFLKRWAFRRIRHDEAAAEIEAQFETIAEAGVKPAHVDGHHNIHLIPAIADIAVILAREKQVEWFRRSSAPIVTLPPFHPRNIAYSCFNLPARVASSHYRMKEMKSADSSFQLIGRTDFLSSAIFTYLSKNQFHALEFVCHPMLPDPPLNLPPETIERRKSEMDFFLNLDPAAFTEKTGYTLTSRKNIF